MNSWQSVLCLSRLVGGSRNGYTNLRYADLRLANLRDADLRDADLRHADLRSAYLRDADLRVADLQCAYLWYTDLRCADLWRVDLRGADLQGACKFGREASPSVCSLATVGAPWDCIDHAWSGYDDPPDEYDYWVGLASLHMLGSENE